MLGESVGHGTRCALTLCSHACPYRTVTQQHEVAPHWVKVQLAWAPGSEAAAQAATAATDAGAAPETSAGHAAEAAAPSGPPGPPATSATTETAPASADEAGPQAAASAPEGARGSSPQAAQPPGLSPGEAGPTGRERWEGPEGLSRLQAALQRALDLVREQHFAAAAHPPEAAHQAADPAFHPGALQPARWAAPPPHFRSILHSNQSVFLVAHTPFLLPAPFPRPPLGSDLSRCPRLHLRLEQYTPLPDGSGASVLMEVSPLEQHAQVSPHCFPLHCQTLPLLILPTPPPTER